MDGRPGGGESCPSPFLFLDKGAKLRQAHLPQICISTSLDIAQAAALADCNHVVVPRLHNGGVVAAEMVAFPALVFCIAVVVQQRDAFANDAALFYLVIVWVLRSQHAYVMSVCWVG